MEKLEIIKEEDIVLREVLGGGGFGTVHRGEHKIYGDVAVKVLKSIVNKDMKETIRREAYKMKKTITSEYFVRIKGLVETDQTMSIVMEYFELGSLRSFRRYLDGDCWPRMVRMIQEISMGMNYLHSLDPPTLHRDLKVDNIFVGQGFQIKIGDFGLAKDESSISSSNNRDISGTCTHLPPELLSGDVIKPTVKMDIYGFSITVFEFVSGNSPWPQLAYIDAGQRVLLLTQWLEKGKRPALTEVPQETPERVVSIMEKCWHQDPNQRPSFQEIQEEMTELYDSEYKRNVRKADFVINRNMLAASSFHTEEAQDPESGFESSAGASTNSTPSRGASSAGPTMSNGSKGDNRTKASKPKDDTGRMLSMSKTTQRSGKPQKHVMISYQWDSQERMVKLRDELNRKGFDIWMDVDKMEGDMSDRMAEAVEGASVVLVCYSEKYQRSQNCKKEIEYAQFRKVPIIPLRYEDHEPSGYLGLAISSLLYYDISSDKKLTKNLPNIVKALKKHSESEDSQGRKAKSQQRPVENYENFVIGSKPESSGTRRPRPPAPLPEPESNKPPPPLPRPKPKWAVPQEELYENLEETKSSPSPRRQATLEHQTHHGNHGNQPASYGGARPREPAQAITGPAQYPQITQPVPQMITQSTGFLHSIQKDIDKSLGRYASGGLNAQQTIPSIGAQQMGAAPIQTTTPAPAPAPSLIPTVPQMGFQKQIQVVQQQIKSVHCFYHYIAVCGGNQIGVYDLDKHDQAAVGFLEPEYTLTSPDWDSSFGIVDVTTAGESILAIVFGNSKIYLFDEKQSHTEKCKIKIAKGADPRALEAGYGKVAVVTSDMKLRVFTLPNFKVKSTAMLFGLPSTIHVNQRSLLIATTNSVLRFAMDRSGTLGKKTTINTSNLGSCKGALFHGEGPKGYDLIVVLCEAQFTNGQRDGTMHTFLWNAKRKEYINAGCIARGIPSMIWKGMHIDDKGQIVVACEPNTLLLHWPYTSMLSIASKSFNY